MRLAEEGRLNVVLPSGGFAGHCGHSMLGQITHSNQVTHQESPMESNVPKEVFPRIGTVENPALFFDGDSLFLSYRVAPVDGDGTVVLRFSDVIHFEQNPVNVEGISAARYPASPWSFTEVIGSDRTSRWRALNPRFWTISFNDVMVEVVFSAVQEVHVTTLNTSPSVAILTFLCTRYPAEVPVR